MLDTILILGCIVFFILLSMAFQERSIMYKDYPTSCDVTYIPKKENIYMLSPSNFKTRTSRRLELEGLDNPQLKSEIFNHEYTEENINNIYSTKYDEFDGLTNEQLIEIILDIESDSFKKEISPNQYEDDTFLDKIND